MSEPKMLSEEQVKQILDWMQMRGMYTSMESLCGHIAAQAALLERYRAALEQIAKGEGPYSMDNHQFACNVIEESKRLANEALRGEGQ